MRRAAKVDANQQEIVSALRSIPGVSVAVTSGLGDGFVDIVVGRDFGGETGKRNFLIEIKNGNNVKSKRRLTTAEGEFQKAWRGQYDVCESLDDVLKLIGII